jgi:hypothetical protein
VDATLNGGLLFLERHIGGDVSFYREVGEEETVFAVFSLFSFFISTSSREFLQFFIFFS